MHTCQNSFDSSDKIVTTTSLRGDWRLACRFQFNFSSFYYESLSRHGTVYAFFGPQKGAGGIGFLRGFDLLVGVSRFLLVEWRQHACMHCITRCMRRAALVDGFDPILISNLNLGLF
jgi:hypothetical protein